MVGLRTAFVGVLLAGVFAGGYASLLDDTVVAVSVDPHDPTVTTPVTDATIYVTGSRWGGCACTVNQGAEATVGNMTPTGRSQIAVLSPTKALFFEPDEKVWSFYPGDLRQVEMKAPLRVPVTIWKLTPNAQTISDDATFAKEQLLLHGVGLDLNYTLRDVASVGIRSAGCADVTRLKGTIDPDTNTPLYDDKAINVYYAEACGGPECSKGGWSCPQPSLANFIYPISDKSILLHEIGHALLGDESHWTASVGRDNAMQDAMVTGRSSLSAGQAIMMNNERKSALALLYPKRRWLECGLDCPKREFDASWSECAQQTHTQPAPEVDVLVAWSHCTECTGGELERLIDAVLVQDGGDAVFTRLRNQSLPRNVQQLDNYQQNATARLQIRSFHALMELALRRHDNALGALQAASTANGYREDVRRRANDTYDLVRRLLPQ